MKEKNKIEERNGKYAWVTLIATNDFIQGAILLNNNLQKVKTKYPFYAIVTNNITKENLHLLDENNVQYKRFPYISFQGTAPREGKTRDSALDPLYSHCMLSKLYMFTFTEYEKIAYIDADIEFLQNCDHYLEQYEPFSGIIPPWEQDCVHGCFYIIKPSYEEFWRGINISLDNNYTNDEQTFKEMYPNFPQQKDHHFPLEDFYSEDEKIQRIWHHDGPIKPWMKEK